MTRTKLKDKDLKKCLLPTPEEATGKFTRITICNMELKLCQLYLIDIP